MNLLDHVDQAAAVVVFFTLLGFAYDAGRKAQEITALKKWRDSLDEKLDAMSTTLTTVKTILDRRHN